MTSVSRFFLSVCFLLMMPFTYGQTSSSKLKSEQKKIEQKINATKTLLSKSQENTSLSLQELQLIESQIKFREQLLKNYDNQIRSAELTIEKKELTNSKIYIKR